MSVDKSTVSEHLLEQMMCEKPGEVAAMLGVGGGGTYVVALTRLQPVRCGARWFGLYRDLLARVQGRGLRGRPAAIHARDYAARATVGGLA